jgi:hypothetical protein
MTAAKVDLKKLAIEPDHLLCINVRKRLRKYKKRGEVDEGILARLFEIMPGRVV